MKKLMWMIAWMATMGLILMACSSLPALQDILPGSAQTQAANTPLPPTPEPSATPVEEFTQTTSLQIWVPPQFLPAEGSTDGNIFLSRVEEFTSRRPQLEVNIRPKALEGDSGMLETLRAAQSAAPLIMPDIIALPRQMMEQAFDEGLIIPLDDFTEVMSEESWFDYASALAEYRESVTGIPMAGDALVLAYKNDTDEDPPSDWESLLASQKPLAFPASAEDSLITFAYYESLLEERRSEEEQLQLEGDILQEVLTFYRDAQTANVMPYWLTQFETDLQAWESYQERQSTLALAWSSQYFVSDSPNTGLAPIPTREGKAFSYATGWVWCVVVSDPETELAAVELIEYLVEDNFLAAWTAESSYLPVRTTGFKNWSEDAFPLVFQQILPSAVLPPHHQSLNELGPPLRDAVVAVLKDQSDPAQVTADLLDRLNGQE